MEEDPNIYRYTDGIVRYPRATKIILIGYCLWLFIILLLSSVIKFITDPAYVLHAIIQYAPYAIGFIVFTLISFYNMRIGTEIVIDKTRGVLSARSVSWLGKKYEYSTPLEGVQSFSWQGYRGQSRGNTYKKGYLIKLKELGGREVVLNDFCYRSFLPGDIEGFIMAVAPKLVVEEKPRWFLPMLRNRNRFT